MTEERNRFAKGPACAKCGWHYPGFHVCLDISEEQMKKQEPIIKRTGGGGKGTTAADWMGTERREHLKEANRARWAGHHEENSERDDEVLKLYNEGTLAGAEIARRFDISKNKVARILERADQQGKVVNWRGKGSNLAGRPRSITNEQALEIVRIYKEELLGQREVAEKLNISVEIVKKVLKTASQAGVVTLRTAKETLEIRNADRDRKIVELYKTGNYGYMAISKELGIGDVTVARAVRAAADRGEVTVRPLGRNATREVLRSPESDAEIVRRYTQEGAGLKTLCTDYHVGEEHIRQVLRDHDVVIRKAGYYRNSKVAK